LSLLDAAVVSDKVKVLEWYTMMLGIKTAYAGSKSNPDLRIQGTAENPEHWIDIGKGRSLTRIHLYEMSDRCCNFRLLANLFVKVAINREKTSL
jgi:hypothetical protein